MVTDDPQEWSIHVQTTDASPTQPCKSSSRRQYVWLLDVDQDVPDSLNELHINSLAAPAVADDASKCVHHDNTATLPSAAVLAFSSPEIADHRTAGPHGESSTLDAPRASQRQEESHNSILSRGVSAPPAALTAGDRRKSMRQRSDVGDITAKLWEAFVLRNERVRRLRIRAADRRKAAANHRSAIKKHLMGRLYRGSSAESAANEGDGDSAFDTLGVAELFEELEKHDEKVDQAEEHLITEEDKLISVAPRMALPNAHRAFAEMHKPKLDHRGENSVSEADIDMDLDQILDPEAETSNTLRLQEQQLEDEILDLRQERNGIMVDIIDGPEEQAGLHDASFQRLDEIDERERWAKERLADISAERERILDETAAQETPGHLEQHWKSFTSPSLDTDHDMQSPWVMSLNTTPLASPSPSLHFQESASPPNLRLSGPSAPESGTQFRLAFHTTSIEPGYMAVRTCRADSTLPRT